MEEQLKKLFSLGLVLIFLSILSFSEIKKGVLIGTIVSADGSGIPGVKMTLEGDGLETLTIYSSENGDFGFIDLIPQNYKLKCDLEGDTPVIRKEVEIKPGEKVVVNILIEESPPTEAGGIYGMRNVFVKETNQVKVEISKEFLETVPTGRNPWAVLSAVPGIMIDRADVGGTDGGKDSNFYVGGVDNNDTTWNMDGINITDPSSIGRTPAYLNTNTFEEIEVTLGGSDITAQTGGVQLNYVTKRGRNKLSGSFHIYVEDDAWEMNQDPPEPFLGTNPVTPGITRFYQYGVNLGGPIVKDKLWWFGSWAVQDIHKRTEIDLEDAAWLVSGYGKLNFQLGDTSGNFMLSYNDKLKWGTADLSPLQQDGMSLWDQTGPGYLYYGGLSHVFGKLMLNVKVVYTDGGFTLDPRGADINLTSYTKHLEGNEFKVIDGWSRIEGSNQYISTDRNSLNIAFDGNYFLEGTLGGDHEIRFGVDYYTADTTSQILTPNQRISYVFRGAPHSNYLEIIPDYLSSVNFKRISAYFQDNIDFGRIVGSLGLRYDKETGRLNSFTQPSFTWYEPGSPHHGEALWPSINSQLQISEFDVPTSWSHLSPRLSLTYDITGNGKNVVKLSAARYMSQSGNLLTSIYIPDRYGLVQWNDANLDDTPSYAELGSLFYYNPFISVDPLTDMNNVRFDHNYNTPYLDELTLMFERAITDNLAVSLTGFYKKKKNLAQDVDSRGSMTYLTKGIMADGTIETKSNWVNIGTTLVGGVSVPTYEQIEDPVGNYYYNLEKGYNRYLGLLFRMDKKFSNNWMANFSFTYSDWKRYRFEEETLDLNNFDFFNEGVVTSSSTGFGMRDIWINSKWMVKFTGLYQFPLGISFSTFFLARQGAPQPLRRRFLVNQGVLHLYKSSLKAGDERLPTFWMLNLGLEKAFRISDKVTASFVIDWYNTTNNKIELKHNLNIVGALPFESVPVMWTNPGLFQFGIRVNF